MKTETSIQKPHRYTIFCAKTGKVKKTNKCPSIETIGSWEHTIKRGIVMLKPSAIVYEDMRYPAKERLYKYIKTKKQKL